MLSDNPNAKLILVVEDDDSHAELIQRSFEHDRDEYRMEIAGSLLDAWKVIEHHSPNLVLSDYRLPDGDGDELVVMVNDVCPVIMMTSQGNEQVAVRAMKIGAQDYIVKSPETYESLPRTVKYALMTWSLIVARRQAAEAAYSAKKDWERTFDAVPDLISIVDLNHNFLRVNRAMADRCGVEPHEIVGRKCCELVHDMKCPAADCPVAGMLLDGCVHSIQVEEKKLNGFFDITVSPLFDEEGTITSFVHVMRDITEHKKTEELVRLRLKFRDSALKSSVDELMQETLDACELLTDSSIGFFHLVDEDQQNLTLQAWSSNTLATMCTAEGHGRHYPVSRAGVWAECFHSRDAVIHNDYANLPNRKGMPPGHAPVVRVLTVPVVIDDKVVSIIGVGNKPSPYTEQDAHIVRQFVIFASEVIGRKKAIIDLEESEKKHKKLASEQQIILNTSSVGICYLKDRKVFWSNPAFDMIFGRDAESVINIDTAELYAYAGTYEYIGEEAYPIIDSGGIYSHDVKMKKKDGSPIWCHLVGQAINPGNSEDGSIWILQDITESKQMTRLLAENEIRLRTLVQTIPDLIWLKDVNGVYLFCNSMFERFIGAREADIVGKTDYDFVETEAADSFREHDRRAIAAGEPIRYEKWSTFADNGNQVLLDILNTPMFDSEGHLIGVLRIARDITERKQLEDERRTLEAQFQQTQKLESLGVLAGGIAHDFNNILTIILGHCYMVKQNIDSGTADKEHVQKIEAAATRAAELCHQMLTYAGQRPQTQTRINLWLLVNEVVKMLTSAINKSILIELDLRRDVPELSGDSAQIQQIVMNLIINASEAIGDNIGTIRIILRKTIIKEGRLENDFWGRAIPVGKYATLEVCDTGCGMNDETKSRVFEPFFTTKFTGRGLGMSAVLGIVKEHDGAVQIISAPGIGTTFRIYFPLPDVSGIVEAVPAVGPVSLPKVNGTILLVDDEEALRTIGSALLSAMGFSTVTASNGREALEIYRERGNGIDLILMDVIMPVMGGIESYRLLREISPSIPIVFCSGCSFDEIMKDIDSDEHSLVIQKPYNPDQLREVIVKLIDKTE